MLAHSIFLTRWLKPVWEDEAMWRVLCLGACHEVYAGLRQQSQGQSQGQFRSHKQEQWHSKKRTFVGLPWGKPAYKASGGEISFPQPLSEGGIVTVHNGVGIMALVLSHHCQGFDLLEDMAERADALWVIDWAMPERNLDYLGYSLPWALSFMEKTRVRKRFRSFIGHGVEGFVERFNTSQKNTFLRYQGHKKYRAGSIIAVCYTVEKNEG